MNPPVILHLSSIDYGGAYDYTRNIHQNLISIGYQSYIVVVDKLITPDDDVLYIPQSKIPIFERIKRKIHWTFMNYVHPHIEKKYDGSTLTERITLHNPLDLLKVLPQNPDYIFVHWVGGFANAKYVRDLQKITNARVFYVMIDQAILSGACHYPWDCKGYQSGCKNCKMTSSKILKFFIRRNFLFKEQYLVKEKNVIYPTTFDYNRLQKSFLWKDAKTYKLIEAIDENLFHPIVDKKTIRRSFNIPEGKKVVFMGSTYLNETRKGMSILIDAIKRLSRSDIIFLVAGKENLPPTKQKLIYAGHLTMERLAQAYQIADVFVCPSLEDSGPQMINMSIMSGTPVVAFEMGVALDIVNTGETGYRAKLGDVEDMVNGLNYILDLTESEYNIIKRNCRELALSSFSKKCQLDFFDKLINNL